MKKSILVVAASIALTLSLAGCEENVQTAAEKADQANRQAQDDVKTWAIQVVPVPHITKSIDPHSIELYNL